HLAIAIWEDSGIPLGRTLGGHLIAPVTWFCLVPRCVPGPHARCPRSRAATIRLAAAFVGRTFRQGRSGSAGGSESIGTDWPARQVCRAVVAAGNAGRRGLGR